MSKRPRYIDEKNDLDNENNINQPQTSKGDIEVEEVHYDVFCDNLAEDSHENDGETRYIEVSPEIMQSLNPSMTMADFLRGRKRAKGNNGYIDYSHARYYDRYKQQEYTRRNDFMKYCHVCRKKTVGKLRVLPGDLRLRKVWILRTNLDEERSAELWLKELACEGSHGGEFCEAHFAPGTSQLKGNQLFPIDVRPPEGRHSVMEDISFNFDTIRLQCVFCGRHGQLNSMLPFIRNRSKRAKWIDVLANGDVDFKVRLKAELKGGVTQFLCDWHVADSSFEINGFGEWRLLKNALPDPRLTEAHKRGIRIYLVDKCRDPSFWERESWRMADRNSRLIINEEENVEHIENDDDDDNDNREAVIEHYLDAEKHLTSQNDSNVKNENNDVEFKRKPEIKSEISIEREGGDLEKDGIEYSDDSDEENEMIEKFGEIPYQERLCQVCSRIEPIGHLYSIKPTIRTWPFDEYRHKKWLEIMDWPVDFEESMKTLWQKRKTEGNLSANYHFCPINVCQSHLDYRKLPERMEAWLKSFCVICDSCMSSESLVVPFPPSLEKRERWVNALFPVDKSVKFQLKKVQWLRKRLLRRKATRYRLCVYHFSHDSFTVGSEGEIIFDENSIPLSMDADEFDSTPRGPNSVCRCVLCEDWKKQENMIVLRNPVMESEKAFLFECLMYADKSVVKKTVNTLFRTGRSTFICSMHFPDNMDPFSIIAERRIMYGVAAECVLCSHVEDCIEMIPFPSDDNDKIRTKWINSMCREPWIYRFLTNRLSKDGRHYLCSMHFSKNSLRFLPGLGLWKRASSTPLLSCTTEEERQIVWNLSKSDHVYHPLILESIDSDGIEPINYEHVVDVLGYDRILEIEKNLKESYEQDDRCYYGRSKYDNSLYNTEENRITNTEEGEELNNEIDLETISTGPEIIEEEVETIEPDVVEETCEIYENDVIVEEVPLEEPIMEEKK